MEVTGSPPPATDEVLPVTEKIKKERTEAQKQTLLKARAKALEVRKTNAELRRQEKQKEKQLKEVRKDQIEPVQPSNESDQEEEEEIKEVQRPRKKIKRKIVVVQSSESEEEEIEVKLPRSKKEAPKAPPDPKQIKYERSMQRMFTLD